jgi:hypothetical protein
MVTPQKRRVRYAAFNDLRISAPCEDRTAARQCSALFTPFFKVGCIIAAPSGGPEITIAAMRDRQGFAAQRKPSGTRGAAEIQIIKMEIKAGIKTHALGAQGITPRGQQYTIKQFAWRGGWPKIGDRAEGRLAMGDSTGQIFWRIPNQFTLGRGQESPGRLPRNPALIAGNAHDIEGSQRVDDPINKKIILYPNIIMHKNQYLGSIGGIQGSVVDCRQASGIFEGDARCHSFVEGKAPQGRAQRGFLDEILPRQSGCADDSDHVGSLTCQAPFRKGVSTTL